MTPNHAERLSRTTKALRTSLLVVLEHVDELSRLAEEHGAAPTGFGSPPIEPICRVDRGTFTVFWQDRACFLGHTLPFRLLEKLAQRSNHYVSVDRLMQELWGGPKAPSTIRSAVSDLRIKLRESGMRGLADMIDGTNTGYYGLIKKHCDSSPDALPTVVRRQSDRHRETSR